jgi:hypothetical protein
MSTDSKKSILKYNANTINNNNLTKNNESTMETNQEMNFKPEIEDSVYEQFLERLTISKFKEFSFYCKEKEIENLKHDMKIKKSVFIQIMKTIFPGRTEFMNLYELIFNRFKLLRCKIIYNQKNDNYFINNLYSNEEIDIFEINCALACFLKCFFLEKLKILFDLADSDEDGFINGSEVKKLIYTLNYLFCREENNLNIESTVILLSLASIKAKKSYDLIMRYPGNLLYIIQEEKYINFHHFESAITRVYNYKYGLFPLFISLKYSLNLNRDEKELEIRKSNLNDYSKISNEIVSVYKKIGDIGKSDIDFKKNLEQEKERYERAKVSTQIKTSTQILKSSHFPTSQSNFSKYNKNVKISSSPINLRKETNNNRYIINYNKICGLEVYPGKLKIKDKAKENLGTTNFKRISRFPMNTKSLSINSHDLKKGASPLGYMTLVEILDEINFLINKHKIIDAGGEELSKIWNETNDDNDKIINKLKEPFPPTTIDTLKPYIFEEIFQKKLH